MSVEVPAPFQRLVRVAPQRWLLGAMAVVSGAGASIVAGVSGGGLPPLVLLIVGVLAVLSAVRPDAHTALVLVAVVVWQWVVVVDDPTGPAVVAVALALLVFHSTIALMAPSPVAARLDPAILRCWLRRTVLVAVATVATWGLVLLLDQRRASGSAVVTLAGFVTALVLVALLQSPRRSREPVRE
jgi:cell division protein FtsW (lipid II flippase)